MTQKVILLICLVLVACMMPASAWSLGGSDADPANQIGRETQKCQAAIGKLSVKFATQIVKGISRCFDGVIRCDQKDEAAVHDECVGKLLVVDRGLCARGRLAGASFPYFGATSSVSVDALSKDTIGRAYFRFIEKLEKACLGPKVDLSIAGTGLGLDPTPLSKGLLAEALNSNVDGRGIACSAHRLLNDAYPLMDQIVDLLIAHPDVAGVALAILILDDETPSFSDCR